MSMFFEFMSHLLILDIAWMIEFILENLFWLFALSLLVHVLFEGKKFFVALIFMTFALWLWGDFETLSGVGLFGAQVLLIYYLSKISILTMVENSPAFKKHLVVISTVTGVSSIIIANLLL